MMKARLLRGTLWGEKGASLIEVVMALALVGLVVPGALAGLSTLLTDSDHAYDRSVAFELAQSQVEDIQRQDYQENAANYSLISKPSGYSISVAATAIPYTYPAPLGAGTQETLQEVTVTVTGVRGNMNITTYKVRR